ncbi:bifunctional aminoglycoside phosphotransferase/ATP-binding protein [Nisaea nitritireducens]|uniref:bifunctional aminoglycoside phosphotransferase/ATP-binding protein n=1 Tax=Nisaea nitritireducens TaxID=568392 RepID=UPI001867F7CF|nr:bifunctional aminoglycoside phosphotransferase/ATP-binding protein [Nisaea nitritireducens]
MSHRTMEETENQSAALEFLALAKNYDPPPDEEPVHIATHGSHVFLAGDRAYKMKRAVSFPYMDFGTLERRKTFTEAELTLNSRAAPDLYLGIRRLTREKDGAIAFDGPGETIEYVLEMRRFEQDALLDRMAEDGTLTPELIEQTADRIRAFHNAAESLPADDASGAGAEGMRWVIEENLEEFAAQPEHFPPDETAAYTAHAREALAQLTPLLDARVEAGHAKHCHGDLHLRNICLIDGEPTLFDGLEFNPRFACIDTLYDLAYFLSDLDIRGLPCLANLAFNRYFIDGGYDGLPCLPLFLSTRSAVRAKIMVSGAEAQEDPSIRKAMLEQSRVSFQAAQRQIEPATPVLIGVGGFSGSGKSTLAQALAQSLSPPPGAVHLRSDVIRKRLHGCAPTERLPAAAYSSDSSAKVYSTMLSRAAEALQAGYTVIMDAVNDRPEDRQAISALAQSLSAPFKGFWLDVPEEVMARRIAGRSNDASDATETVMLAQARHGHGSLGNWETTNAGGTAAATLALVKSRLGLF